ncbi:MAG: hypothetical protein A3F35_00290 [Candidatus Woykebacteria bacterium RIFCSPHIGHO2_12_FULL_45_10]|uniref:Sugar ABC transporter substrate-binding protein n=1 Tax=Candidatus Woykebacteria bacterium RIFCSPHIGHO2_12_FULL_45_10 TaxID=1802603 RepID=A0A1G1WNN7_9BACT|nr:MAG: hypothetical protein A3F35_00290 [Candidatus Woykebacteria bacterium RIFCSPHIGHO2_12_FULL_45_10]
MRKFLPYLIGFLLLVVGIVGALFLLYHKQQKESGPVVLHYVGLWDPDVINPLKLEYQKSHPNVIIEYEQKEKDRYFSYLDKALAGKNPPDLFWWHNGWGPVMAQKLASMPATTYSEADYEKIFYPITKADLKISGSYRGIPLEIDGLVLAYNKDLLAAKGLTTPPADLISLKTNYAPNLTVLDGTGQVVSGGVALGATNNVENFSEILGLFMLQNKVTFIKNRQNALAKNITLDGRNLAADALSVYNSFLYADKVWSKALPPSVEAFAEGKVAMIYLPAYRFVDLKDYLDQKNLKLNFGVSTVPQLVSSEPVTWGSYWAQGVAASSKHATQAWDFAKFLSEKASLRKLYGNETKIRKVGRAYPRVDMAKEQASDPLIFPFVTQAPYAKGWYLYSDGGDDQLNGKIVDIFAKRIAESPSGADQLGTINNITKDIQPILESFGLVLPLPKQTQ